ncbi:MAG: VWA domain-containing protein [Acidobacteria bacterium]|nr:VWA domain-containing protein [Acidobacteriota bacterium]
MSTRIGALPVILCAAVLSLSAQSAPQKPQDPQRPVFRSEANFVRVDVFPTRDGSPVKDLVAADFEVLEDGVPQKVETFEFVEVRGNLVQPDRREPNTVQQSREMMRDPRARVFVLFLDIPHVTMHGTWNVRAPLLRLIDRILGPDDLVGVMTPQMSARDIAFARKPDVVADGLLSRWPWGERFTLAQDERERLYEACYPWPELKDVVKEMTARRRERSTLDALNEVVLWLRDQREERKAILTISEGWLLFGENRDLTRPRVIDPRTGAMEPIPGPEPIGTGPDGRLRIGHDRNYEGTKTTCDTDRGLLSNLNNERYLRDIIGAANTANASFYTVDPRGLAVFDSPIGPDKPPPVAVDLSNLRNRMESLRTLADATDGMAVANSNDIEKGLRRMADDLTSYYLLGYYSTNSKLDGRFRQIKVRTKQPGVDMRARRGYKAATEREVSQARLVATAPVPEHVAVARTALGGLARLRPASEFSAHAIAISGDTTTVWVSGELKAAAAAPATVDINIKSGALSSSAAAAIPAGGRAFLVPVVLASNATEPIDVRVRVGQGSGLPLTDMLKIDAVSSDGLGHPMLYRRGPSTGNRVQAAGSPLYLRTERVRLEIPASADTKMSGARVLDRNGLAFELPVTTAERTDEAGQRWLTAEVILAALAPGDYIIEMSGTVKGAAKTVLSAIRIVR